jgi:vacuolar-type H+-ATPase subunit C/Vma6
MLEKGSIMHEVKTMMEEIAGVRGTTEISPIEEAKKTEYRGHSGTRRTRDSIV